MTYKDPEKQKAFQKGYYAGYRKATIDHLGKVCNFLVSRNGEVKKCGSTEEIQIHHIFPLSRRARTLKDLENLEDLELRCEKHHAKETN